PPGTRQCNHGCPTRMSRLRRGSEHSLGDLFQLGQRLVLRFLREHHNRRICAGVLQGLQFFAIGVPRSVTTTSSPAFTHAKHARRVAFNWDTDALRIGSPSRVCFVAPIAGTSSASKESPSARAPRRADKIGGVLPAPSCPPCPACR